MTAASPRILSIIPPMTQLNTPYPATAYLTGFLRSRGFHAEQTDLALALVLELLSPAGLPKIKAAAEAIPGKKRSNTIKTFLNEFDRYQASIGPAIALLQGRDGSIAHRICPLRIRPLRRIAGPEPGQLQSAGHSPGRAANAGRYDPAKSGQNGR